MDNILSKQRVQSNVDVFEGAIDDDLFIIDKQVITQVLLIFLTGEETYEGSDKVFVISVCLLSVVSALLVKVVR